LTAAVRPLITLLTDFGTRDIYVASLKGVILSLNPEVNLVDLSHEVPPQDIRAGAFMLAAAAASFPPGAIHLAVVDPGVGSRRRALAARCRGHYWVGPDNGLFHLIFRHAPDLAVVSLENPAYFRPRVSATCPWGWAWTTLVPGSPTPFSWPWPNRSSGRKPFGGRSFMWTGSATW
jgi:S-adenosylmethionine hydrolase